MNLFYYSLVLGEEIGLAKEVYMSVTRGRWEGHVSQMRATSILGSVQICRWRLRRIEDFIAASRGFFGNVPLALSLDGVI